MPAIKRTLLTTEEFWDVMCNPHSFRLSRFSIARYGVVYFTTKPPEDVPGFLESKIDLIYDRLTPEPRRPFRALWARLFIVGPLMRRLTGRAAPQPGR